jgi:hypothetical protein
MVLGEESSTSIEQVYHRDHALRVVQAAMQDYEEEFGG